MSNSSLLHYLEPHIFKVGEEYYQPDDSGILQHFKGNVEQLTPSQRKFRQTVDTMPFVLGNATFHQRIQIHG